MFLCAQKKLSVKIVSNANAPSSVLFATTTPNSPTAIAAMTERESAHPAPAAETATEQLLAGEGGEGAARAGGDGQDEGEDEGQGRRSVQHVS